MTEQSFTLDRGPRDLRRLFAFLAALDVTKAFEIIIRPAKKERSDLQNRALWGVAYKTLHKATGNDPEDLHEYFCGEYFGWVEYRVMGKRRLRPKRTTTKDDRGKRDVISTLELKDFYAFIQQRAAETVAVYVPDPDPLWWQREDQKRAA
jgi:hypothetical protein